MKVLDERQGDRTSLLSPQEAAVGHADVVEDLCHLGGRGGVVVGGEHLAQGGVCPFQGRRRLRLAPQGGGSQQEGVRQLLGRGVEGGQCAAGCCHHAVGASVEGWFVGAEWRGDEGLVLPAAGHRVGASDVDQFPHGVVNEHPEVHNVILMAIV